MSLMSKELGQFCWSWCCIESSFSGGEV